MQYAIFDLDGTLSNSMVMWRGVGNAYLAEKGYPPHENLKNATNATWLEEFFKATDKNSGLKLDTDDFSSWVNDYALKQYSQNIQLKSGSLEFLDKLYNSGVKMCICSSTHKSLMLPLLERFDILKYFEFTCHCTEFGKEKDSPEIFLYCMQKLGAKKPCEVVVFEDALYSAKTAKDAGFYLVGIFDETEHRNKEFKETVDLYITDYNQIDINLLP